MAAMYVSRGNEMLAIKDISAARKFYEYAADAGSAAGAMALAKTLDPTYLAGLGVIGLKPDLALAATFYRKAAALGDPDAKARLQALGAN
jgi:TPR repeat protein